MSGGFAAVISMVAGFGILMAGAAWICAGIKTGEGSYFLGYPIAAYGIAGYVAIIMLSQINRCTGSKILLVAAYVLALAALATVPFLVARSYKLKFLCPFCLMSWCCNAAIFTISCFHFFMDGKEWLFAKARRANACW